MNVFRLIPVLVLAFSALPLRAELVDAVKAIVNDRVITYGEVEEFTGRVQETLRRQYAGDSETYQQKLNAAREDSLEQLIERQLILHDFDVQYQKLPDTVVDELIQDRIRERFGDRITLMKTLQAQGMTFEQFRKDVRDQYIESILRNQNVSREIIISPYKIQTYYQAHQDDFNVEEQVKLRMIVLNKTGEDDTNTVSRAREIRQEIKNGASFQEMASVYSQGSQQHQGGDWGWVERSVLRQELADAAFALKPGELSDVIDTPTACYLMLVENKRPAHVRPLGEIRSDIERILRAQEQSRLQKQWIETLKKKTFIRYF